MPDLANVEYSGTNLNRYHGLAVQFQLQVYNVVYGAGQTASTPLPYWPIITNNTTLAVNFISPLATVNLTTSNYTISGPSAITVTGVAWTFPSNVVTLTTTGSYVSNSTYTLNIVSGTCSDGAYTNMTSALFGSGAMGASVGDTTPPTVYSLTPLTSTTLLVIYSESVVASEATDVSHYSLDLGLTPLSVQRLDDARYVLTTTAMTTGTIYTLTVTGVHDLAGNLI